MKNAKPSLGYWYLTDLVNKEYFNTVFTTNFDDLINEAFYRFGNIRPIVCAHDSFVQDILVTAKRPKIIKLHGDYLFDDLKCIPEQTDKLSENMVEKLEQFLREYGLIVCGYSGEDKSIMSVLVNLIEKDSFLRNGLYWCVRSPGDVSEKLVDLLEKDKAYFIDIEGYEDFFSQLHNQIINDQLSFDLNTNENGSNDIVEYWLDNTDVYLEGNQIIQDQLSSLKKTRTKTQLGSAFADFYSKEESFNGVNTLTDQEAAQLLRLNGLIKSRDYQQVIDLTRELINRGLKKDYQKELLILRFNAFKELEDNKSTADISDKLIELEEDNPSHYLRKSDVIEDFESVLSNIDDAIEKDPYFSLSYRKKAEQMINSIEDGNIQFDEYYFQEILSLYGKSQKIDPSARNRAWREEVNFLLEFGPRLNKDEAIQRALEIYAILMKQDPNTLNCARVALAICKNNNDQNAIGANLFDYLETNVSNCYPKYSQSLFSIIVSSALEFENPEFGQRMLSDYEVNLKGRTITSGFLLAKSKLYLEVYQDIDEAIEVLNEAIGIDENIDVITRLIDLYNYKSDSERAFTVFNKYKHVLTKEEQAFLEHEILIVKRDFKAAEQILLSVNGVKEVNEKYCMAFSYLALLDEDYIKAKKITSEFLDRKGWLRDQYPVLIINHEFALQKMQKKVHKLRLEEIQESNVSGSVKAMAHLVSGDQDAALRLMLKSAKKKYSNYLDYIRWPVSAVVKSKFQREFR